MRGWCVCSGLVGGAWENVEGTLRGAQLQPPNHPHCTPPSCPPADGQWLFLCPLNLRMLLLHYGSYAACPPAVSAKASAEGCSQRGNSPLSVYNTGGWWELL